MKGRRSVIGLLILGLGLLAVVTAVYQRRLARDLYPVYSSFRADPRGLKAWHDTVALLPGMATERWLRPWAELETTPRRLIILAGVYPRLNQEFVGSEDAVRALAQAAQQGSRVVLAYRADTPREARKEAGKAEEVDAVDVDEAGGAAEPKDDAAPEGEAAAKANERPKWGMGFKVRQMEEMNDQGYVSATELGRSEGLPETLSWGGAITLALDADVPWRVLYAHAGEPMVVERPWGQGSLVVMGETYPLSNEALQREREPGFFRWLLEDQTRVQFGEYHLGVRENSGIAALIRRYGLSGAAMVFGLGLALFFWRRLAVFLPVPPEPTTVDLTYDSTAGLEALFSRSVPPTEVVETCLAEWERTASERDLRRVRAALAGAAGASPLEKFNLAVQAMRRR